MDLQNLADAVTKGLAYTENGGKPNIENPSSGKTGEMKSIFQYEPKIWHSYSKEILGNNQSPMTADSETYVTNQKVLKWLKEGKTVSQIASIWNSGDENAYTGKFSNGSSSKGMNKQYGVNFDVPGYAGKVLDYTKGFLSDKNAGSSSDPVQSSTNSDSSLDSVMNVMKGTVNDQNGASKLTINQQPKQGLLQGLIPVQKSK